jgi:hypothetical protein
MLNGPRCCHHVNGIMGNGHNERGCSHFAVHLLYRPVFLDLIGRIVYGRKLYQNFKERCTHVRSEMEACSYITEERVKNWLKCMKCVTKFLFTEEVK